MIALDTNIIVRLLVNDSVPQTNRAHEIISSPCFLPATVLLETAWVLKSRYRLPRQVISDGLCAVLDYPTVQIDNEAAVRWALARHAETPSDIADLLHLANSPHANRFVTFDTKLVSQAGPDTPVAIDVAKP